MDNAKAALTLRDARSRLRPIAGDLEQALAMAADALEAPVDGREWISVETPPEEPGTYTCAVLYKDAKKLTEVRRRFSDGEWVSESKVFFYLPNTTPPIPEMPKYEWSPTTTPVGARVTYRAPTGEIPLVTVVDWDDDLVCVRVGPRQWTSWTPVRQAERPIRSIGLPKLIPIDTRLVDFVPGTRELLLSRLVHGDRDWYATPRKDAQAALRLLQAAEEVIAGKQASDPPEDVEQLHADNEKLLAACEAAYQLAEQAILARRTVGHPGDHELLSTASEYDVLELHDLAFAARVKTALAQVTGRSNG